MIAMRFSERVVMATCLVLVCGCRDNMPQEMKRPRDPTSYRVVTNYLPGPPAEVTRVFLDATGEIPMLDRVYTTNELSALIVPGMREEKMKGMFGHPCFITTYADGTEGWEFDADPRVFDEKMTWRPIGFLIIVRKGVVVKWRTCLWGGSVR